MNATEFDQWYTDFCACFPATAAFVNGVEKESRKVLIGHWRKALESCDLADALSATVQMVSGIEEPVPATDRSLTPAHVAKLCGKIRAARTATVSSGERRMSYFPPDAPPKWDMAAIFKALRDCIQRGGNVDALSKRLMPIDRESEPRYKCRTCCDRGIVSCWHPKSMELARLKKLTRGGDCLDVAVRCNCSAGDRFDGYSRDYDSHSKKYRRDTPIVFDEFQWLPYKGFTAEHVAELELFMEHKYRPSNYEPAFDAYALTPAQSQPGGEK